MSIDINRINELARKSKTVGLTDVEKEEQAVLRAEYIQNVRESWKCYRLGEKIWWNYRYRKLSLEKSL